jgi:Fe-S cluster biogenesis protein NfuA
MPDHEAEITEVIGAMNELVARDGGNVTVLGFEAARLELAYSTGNNDECDTCMITPETMKDFVAEGLRSRGIAVHDVVVVDPTITAEER